MDGAKHGGPRFFVFVSDDGAITQSHSDEGHEGECYRVERFGDLRFEHFDLCQKDWVADLDQARQHYLRMIDHNFTAHMASIDPLPAIAESHRRKVAEALGHDDPASLLVLKKAKAFDVKRAQLEAMRVAAKDALRRVNSLDDMTRLSAVDWKI